eukprot:TRINITY_DN17143_c0_g1_i2.p2 TRINITY_DN17143_c0_g1~~TRINITY_DN17143_c0_g1_i2.p2  ORF type:complete len:153 (-),score=27.03 TRINITY_DN17143_c0_g1_i2:3-461(-)
MCIRDRSGNMEDTYRLPSVLSPWDRGCSCPNPLKIPLEWLGTRNADLGYATVTAATQGYSTPSSCEVTAGAMWSPGLLLKILAAAGAETVSTTCSACTCCGPVGVWTVSYTHLRAHETPEHLVCRLLLEKKKKNDRSGLIVVRVKGYDTVSK